MLYLITAAITQGTRAISSTPGTWEIQSTTKTTACNCHML
jgi:hypothetical protein